VHGLARGGRAVRSPAALLVMESSSMTARRCWPETHVHNWIL
jgi:hypothetical protein